MSMFALTFNAVAVTAQQDLFEITSPADAITMIHEIRLSQSTEVGDTMEEGLSILFKRGATATGTGGSQAVVPTPMQINNTAYGGVCDTNNTAKASGGTIVTLLAENWNIRMPYLYLPTPECRMIVAPSTRFTVELATTPADSITLSGTVMLEEIG